MGKLDDVEIRHYAERVTASYVDGAGARYLVELARSDSRDTRAEERWVAGVQRDGREIDSEDPVWGEVQDAFDAFQAHGRLRQERHGQDELSQRTHRPQPGAYRAAAYARIRLPVQTVHRRIFVALSPTGGADLPLALSECLRMALAAEGRSCSCLCGGHCLHFRCFPILTTLSSR